MDVPLETLQLLSQKFFSISLSFQDIYLVVLKWDTRYNLLEISLFQYLVQQSGKEDRERIEKKKWSKNQKTTNKPRHRWHLQVMDTEFILLYKNNEYTIYISQTP